MRVRMLAVTGGRRYGRVAQPQAPGPTARHEMSMTVALEPGGRAVDITRAEVRAVHHRKGRRGLICVLCGELVHIRERTPGRFHLVHPSERNHDLQRGTEAETYEHWLLKTWVRNWLDQHGWAAAAETAVPDNGAVPDVSAERASGVGHDQVAIEVQRSTLSREAAQQRTRRLETAGYRVLWLSRDWSLVDHVPSAGIDRASDAGQFPRGRTAIGGLYYWVRFGRLGQLRIDGAPRSPALLTSGRRAPALETFLREFCEKRVIWMSHATGHAGWADEVQWREHVEAAARQLDESRAQLAAHDQQAIAEEARHQIQIAALEIEVTAQWDRCAELERDLAAQRAARVDEAARIKQLVDDNRGLAQRSQGLDERAIRAEHRAVAAESALVAAGRERRRYAAQLRRNGTP